MFAEKLNSQNINNKNVIIATKELATTILENANTAEIYSASLNAQKTLNSGNLEALSLKGNNYKKHRKSSNKRYRYKRNRKWKVIYCYWFNKIIVLNNSGELKTKELKSKDGENTNTLISKNISVTNIDNSGNILSENLDTKLVK